MSEPTSALTFANLQTEVAILLGISYRGADGTEVDQPPTDTQDAHKVKRIINNAIRMLISDAPTEGWSWLRPTASIVLWADIAVDSTVTAAGVYEADETGYTTITASEATFYQSMELHDIVITDIGTYEIAQYISSTQVLISGDHAFTGKTFSIAADGNYTLPQTFGGQYEGPLRYAEDSGIANTIHWRSQFDIQDRRQISGSYSGYPDIAAVRKTSTSRRWELMVSPEPATTCTVEMVYPLHFDSLTSDSDLHPAGHSFDEVVLAACKARAEMEDSPLIPGNVEYYRQVALPSARKIDARTRPKSLGHIRTGRSRTVPYTRAILNRVTYD